MNDPCTAPMESFFSVWVSDAIAEPFRDELAASVLVECPKCTGETTGGIVFHGPLAAADGLLTRLKRSITPYPLAGDHLASPVADTPYLAAKETFARKRG